MAVEHDVLERLRALRSFDDCVELFHTLGFEYDAGAISIYDWPTALSGLVGDVRFAARHGDFAVIYVCLKTDRLIGAERQVTARLLRTYPHSLLVFSDAAFQLWHIVHVRYDEQAERRRQLRRFTVDVSDARASSRLRTTAERLARLAVRKGGSLSAPELQRRCDAAFRISEVADDFLDQFRHVVAALTAAIGQQNQKVVTTDAEALRQAQVLLDRLVFLYFVQKKGWLNGEEDYLYSRFRTAYDAGRDDSTFYRETLLPLFRALSHPHAERLRNEHGSEEAIPFLNGGLFELPFPTDPKHTTIDERLEVSNAALFDTFESFLERYNFTTTEDTPLDTEVAINPEVIGTIFETFVLTAEADVGVNAPDRRKATGSYYTPRIVVHFICRNSLRFYLVERTGIDGAVAKRLMEFTPLEQATDDEKVELNELITVKQAETLKGAVLDARICDPAVGSGAFPVGMLQEMVKLVTLLDWRRDSSRLSDPNYGYVLKRRIIQDCLYGVDIQEQAAQICELRLWLSLIVDYEAPKELPLDERIKSIEPLPNLTFRIRVGDSLLDDLFRDDAGVPLDIPFGERGFRYIDIIHDLTGAKRAYFEFKEPRGKRELEAKILALQVKLARNILEDELKHQVAEAAQFAGMISKKQQKEADEAKARKERLERLLTEARQAEKELAHPTEDVGAAIRRVDRIRERLQLGFVWQLEFAEVFEDEDKRGFDIIIGNPPFVTARDPIMRERYRQRWPVSCYKKYHLLAPFIEMSLRTLLRPSGQLGFIVSNAFATRDFGRPLIQNVFQLMELPHVVDCSGLAFPGHGTPTCILLGQPTKGRPIAETLLFGTKPGKGQLNVVPEETTLWQETEIGWESVDWNGYHMAGAGLDAKVARSHPWSLNAAGASLREVIEEAAVGRTLRDYLTDDVGFATITASDEIFNHPPHFFRRAGVEHDVLRWFIEGDNIRDWSVHPATTVLAPYSENHNLIPFDKLQDGARRYLLSLRASLENRADFGAKTYAETGKPWWGHHQVTASKYADVRIALGEIASHVHALAMPREYALKQTCQVAPLDGAAAPLVGVLNSSLALFWLKQVCYNKGAGSKEERDRYVYAGTKVGRMPTRLSAKSSERIVLLTNQLAEYGRRVSSLSPLRLFSLTGDAYTDWYSRLPGPEQAGASWTSVESLSKGWQASVGQLEAMRRSMVWLQEELDWLVYAVYGLIPLEHPAVNHANAVQPIPLERDDRPYRLRGNDRDIPASWPPAQKELWQSRLDAIKENPHIAALEQPAYKRRWELPWHDGGFLTAYEWYVREKAEWLLEHGHAGGPIALDTWADELYDDERVRAARGVAMEVGASIGDKDYIRDASRRFAAHLKRIIEPESVPDDRAAFKKKHETFRGVDPAKHLPNGVPRERFRALTAKKDWYVWAGKDLWGGVKGDVWDD